MSVFSILIFGNLLFFLIDKQANIFLTQNIYVPSSLLLNLILLLSLRRLLKIPKKYITLFLFALIGPITSFFLVSLNAFIVISVKYIWIVSCILLFDYLINESTIDKRFQELREFSHIAGYFLLLNLVLSLIFIQDSFVPNEGINTFIFSADNTKKMCFFVLPFFFISGKRNLFIGFILLIYLLLCSRATMLSAVFLFLYFSTFYLFSSSDYSKRTNKILIVPLLLLFVTSLVFITLNLRTVDLSNFISSIDRIVIWTQYITVAIDYPLGLGPEGAFYYLRENGLSSSINFNYFAQFITDQNLTTGTSTSIDSLVTKRANVSAARGDVTISSESMYLDLICSFGLMGFLLVSHLLVSIIVDLKRALTFTNLKFSLIYGSLGANLVYGFFNSYHSGMFFITLLWMMYYSLRSRSI
jgi:hypothetical protein